MQAFGAVQVHKGCHQAEDQGMPRKFCTRSDPSARVEYTFCDQTCAQSSQATHGWWSGPINLPFPVPDYHQGRIEHSFRSKGVCHHIFAGDEMDAIASSVLSPQTSREFQQAACCGLHRVASKIKHKRGRPCLVCPGSGYSSFCLDLFMNVHTCALM